MKEEKAFSSIYFPSDKQHLVKELIELKWKERTSVNNIILHAIEEYCKIHGDGNPNFTITQFADEKAINFLFTSPRPERNIWILKCFAPA